MRCENYNCQESCFNRVTSSILLGFQSLHNQKTTKFWKLACVLLICNILTYIPFLINFKLGFYMILFWKKIKNLDFVGQNQKISSFLDRHFVESLSYVFRPFCLPLTFKHYILGTFEYLLFFTKNGRTWRHQCVIFSRASGGISLDFL